MCLDVCDLLPSSKAGQNLEHQLSKSGTAPALLYGEAQAAESRNDFIHKMKIALKELRELRESRVNLRIIKEKPIASHEKIDITFKEVNKLVAIFTTSIETAKKNQLK
jgi:four helix bundle protein